MHGSKRFTRGLQRAFPYIHVAAAGERAQRLRDMGLLPGVGITVMGRSPMGDLLSLRVMGTTLALRVADAEDVTVSTDD